MRVAVIGGGIAGLAVSWMLQEEHRVTLFERDDHLGGHGQTILVPQPGNHVAAEVGFRYFGEQSHPTVVALVRLLGLDVLARRTSLTIVDHDREEVVVLPPRTAAQAMRLAGSPRRLRELWHLRRLLNHGQKIVQEQNWSSTLLETSSELGIPADVARGFLTSFFAASWGGPRSVLAGFPAYDLLKVLRGGMGGFLELRGGIARYIAALVARLHAVDLRRATPVGRIDREGQAVRVESNDGTHELFDRVVLATDPFAGARLLEGSTALKRHHEILRQFRHFEADIAIHGDRTFMPPFERDWSTVNHFYRRDSAYMSEWAGENEGAAVFRTWLPAGAPVPNPLHFRRRFHHVVVTKETPALQRSLRAVQGLCGIHVAGLYVTDVDHHESALLSAVDVARALAPKSVVLARLVAAAGTVKLGMEVAVGAQRTHRPSVRGRTTTGATTTGATESIHSPDLERTD